MLGRLVLVMGVMVEEVGALLLAGADTGSSGGEPAASASPCCSSRVMDPSCLFTTDEGESESAGSEVGVAVGVGVPVVLA